MEKAMTDQTWHQLVVFVPETHIDQVKQALFAAGAGRLGAYTNCCWQVMGQGQFMPSVESKPAVGTHNTLTHVAEYRLECMCVSTDLKAIIQALKLSHPYETPAYHLTAVQFDVETP